MSTDIKARIHRLTIAVALSSLGVVALSVLSGSVSRADVIYNFRCVPQTSSCTTCLVTSNQYYCSPSVPIAPGFKIGSCSSYVQGYVCQRYNYISCGTITDCVTSEVYGDCATSNSYCAEDY